ncbi:hypothetical protein Pint_27184 [Pistacia integerrima]|uniref:Uncharacterized protein n=1 Tax=Pistacia integerrima TaxID=434235 RepID=A0ACC0YQX9_9ROSI|nr:hypothetical protein Pint_27184 [Pistacia integerrima]
MASGPAYGLLAFQQTQLYEVHKERTLRSHPVQLWLSPWMESSFFIPQPGKSSFDHPKDTLLVGQKLVQGSFLYSSVSKTNQSIGKFKLSMQKDGNLYAFPVESIPEGKYVYWTSNAPGAGRNVSLNLEHDGRLYLRNASTGSDVKNLTEDGNSVNVTILYRATFDVDGILRLYQHQIGTNGSLSSKTLWEMLLDEDRCKDSYCALVGANIACLCPPGFDFVDVKQPLKGCLLNFTMENDCSESKKNSEEYYISSLEHTYWERSEFDVMDFNKIPLRYGMKISRSVTKTLIKNRIGGGNPSTTGNEFSDDSKMIKKAGELRKLVNEKGLDMEEAEKLVKIGLLCVETKFALRPTMKPVILMLEGIVSIPPLASPYPSGRG